MYLTSLIDINHRIGSKVASKPGRLFIQSSFYYPEGIARSVVKPLKHSGKTAEDDKQKRRSEVGKVFMNDPFFHE